MSLGRINIASLIIFLLVLVLPFYAAAEPTYDEQGDLIRPNTEKYTGVINLLGPVEQGTPPYIVIGDIKYMIDQQAVFRNLSGSRTSLTYFLDGMTVEFYAFNNVVTKLREISPSDVDYTPREIAPDQESQPSENGYRLEDGVWVN